MMKDQEMADEMGKQSQIPVHEPRGKKNPQTGQETPTKSFTLKKPKSGLPQPWKAAHSASNPSLQPRLKKPSQEIATTPIPIYSSTPIVKERPRPSPSAGASLHASRIPCPISRISNSGSSSGCQIRVKGGQGEKSEKVQKHQNPSPGTPALPMKQGTLIKHGNAGLPPSVLGKEMLMSINFSLKTKEISSTPTQSSLKTFNNSPALLSTYQVLKKQHRGEIPSLAPLSPSSDMKALLPPDELDLSTTEFVSDEVFTSEVPHCKSHISSLRFKFPESNVQMEMSPSNLSKHGIIPVEYPHPKWPTPFSPTILDFSSRVGQKKSSSKKELEMFDSVSSYFNMESPECITGYHPSQDFVSSNCNDIPDTKILSPSYPLPSSSGMKEMVLSVFHDVSQEEELLLSSKTKICSSIGSSNTSALSSEEKVLGRMEEEIDSENECDEDTGEDTSKYYSCIFL